MQLQSLSRRYTVRRLMETDVDAMLALCSGNPQFYRYHPPMATKASILDDLQAVPPLSLIHILAIQGNAVQRELGHIFIMDGSRALGAQRCVDGTDNAALIHTIGHHHIF